VSYNCTFHAVVINQISPIKLHVYYPASIISITLLSN